MIHRNSIKSGLSLKTTLFPVGVALILSISGVGQTTISRSKNNPYSPSPIGKVTEKPAVRPPVNSAQIDSTFIMQGEETSLYEDRPIIAKRTFKVTKRAESPSTQPSEIYKVGAGDVLFVNLKNTAQGSRYCTVQPDGTIDFPLAGENLIVANNTVDVIEKMLAPTITLFADPQIEVKVREYASHKIVVSGMVENPGEKSLQREAMPLFVIRSQAVVSSAATKVVIKRAPLLKLESYDLNNADTDNVLIFPGNSIEFTADGNPRSIVGSYYIAGEINTAGQKQLTSGLTLYQAVTASGGTKGNPKNATIHRNSGEGIFANTEYSLRSIKDGKMADPVLEAGDVIEIRK